MLETQAKAPAVEILETGVVIRTLTIDRKGVADYLRAAPEAEREELLVRAVEVGVFCLERCGASQDIEFARRQMQDAVNTVQSRVEEIPGNIETALIDKLGTEDGKALAPVRVVVDLACADMKNRLTEVKTLLTDDLDPAKSTSKLGSALGELKDLLDPKRTDSIQGSLKTAVEGVTSADGAIATAVKAAVEDKIKPLKEEIDELTTEIQGRAEAEKIVQQTTLKGQPFEDNVVAFLQTRAAVAGAQVEQVGGDNTPGDVVVVFPDSGTGSPAVKVVVEVKDDQQSRGRKRLSEMLAGAIAERDANAAVFVSRTRDGLAQEIGDWGEGQVERGPWVATVYDQLWIAVRYVVSKRRLANLAASRPGVDSGAIADQLGTIRTAIARVQTIKTQVTKAKGEAEKINDAADSLRREVEDALDAIERALRSTDGGSGARSGTN